MTGRFRRFNVKAVDRSFTDQESQAVGRRGASEGVPGLGDVPPHSIFQGFTRVGRLVNVARRSKKESLRQEGEGEDSGFAFDRGHL